MSYIDAFLDAYLAPADAHPLAPVLAEPEWLTANVQRGLVTVASAPRAIPSGTVEEARRNIRAAMRDYLATPDPEHMLLIRAAPGVGKTFAAAEIAEECAAAGQRVLYAGPRHDFYEQVQAVAGQPELWYEWLPRQQGDDLKPTTCNYVEPITGWLNRGYPAMDFCSGVCGWAYVKDCPYHCQKKRQEPIIYGQHAHVALAHPLKFDVCIGDENPLAAFAFEWVIPQKWLVPNGMDPTQPLTAMLHRLAGLATAGQRLSGLELLHALGGPAEVLEACELFRLDAQAVALAPKLHRAEDAANADYFHLPALVGLLAREARAALANPEQIDLFTRRVNGHDHTTGDTYPRRVILSADGNLLLLLRRPVYDKLPAHVIWLDATGNQHLYETVFRRPVEVVEATPAFLGSVFQVYDRANGKSSLMDKDGNLRATPVAQLKRQVETIAQRYQRPALITFQKLGAEFEQWDGAHFYAARGTNAFQDCDAIIIAGTPQPPRHGLERLARMWFLERMTPFQTSWSHAIRAYAYTDPADGQGRGYPTSGFWADPDLQAVLWSVREAEIIQAAHRGRPILRPVDIWLLTNLPIDELPPTRLLSIADLLDAPPGCEVFRWAEIVAYAETVAARNGFVTAGDLEVGLELHRNTARKYLTALIEHGWTRAAVPSTGGRPAKGITPPSAELLHIDA